jgi:hypothetical protein
MSGGSSEKNPVWLYPDDPTGDVFEEGIALYLAGDWPGARVLLEKADSQMAQLAPALGGDGPCKTLLSYMGNQNFEAPSTWKGYRPLTSK